MAANTNRTKGHDAERLYAKIFKESGFPFCKTSRQSSRMLDDAGIDLNFLPFNVQIKAGYSNGLNEFKTLKIIEERLPILFPPHDQVMSNPNILIHKKDTGRGKKKVVTNELVFIWERDIFKLLGIELKLDIPVRNTPKRGWSFEEILNKESMILYKSKEESLVVMTFETFITLIKNKHGESSSNTTN